MRAPMLSVVVSAVLVSYAFAADPTAPSTAASAGSAMGASNILLIHHKVTDYAQWRPGYDADSPSRDAAGLTNCVVRQSADSMNDVVVTCDMADVKKAKAFSASNTLAATMKQFGVIGKPQVLYLLSAK